MTTESKTQGEAGGEPVQAPPSPEVVAKKKRVKWLWIATAVVAVVVLIRFAAGGEKDLPRSDLGTVRK